MTSLLLASFLGSSVILANSSNFAVLGVENFGVTSTATHVTLSAVIQTKSPFRELVLSWEGVSPTGTSIEFVVRPAIPVERSYSLGIWTEGVGRTSVKNQKDADGEVKTDILVLASDCTMFRIDVHLRGDATSLPQLKKLYAVMTPHGASATMVSGNRGAWGKTINVPQKAQMDYPGGKSLCSPTAVSMILNHWSIVQNAPALSLDVPVVQTGVLDPGWGGTGNWSFNTAYAASISGITAFVSRFQSIEELEHWIEAGIPIATSVSYSLLKGEPAVRQNDGHLVVLVGFSTTGDLVFNDPGTKEVRKTYPRKQFESAWLSSGRTVYVIKPSDWQSPSINGPWPPNKK